MTHGRHPCWQEAVAGFRPADCENPQSARGKKGLSERSIAP